MQELSIPSQSASPYTPVGGSNMPTAPNLGTPVPGTTGGLPALSGLSVFNNPLPQTLQNSNPQQAAKQTQSYGRGQDTMLVHMTPDEVNSLRGLAQQFGGDLTVNPHTGMPEAGWLGKLLPTILGIAGAAFGIPTWAIGLGVGAGQTALTGDLGKGLTAGLQAFGGAGLGQAAGLGGSISNNALGLLGEKAATSAAPALGKAAEGTLEAAFDKSLGVKAPGFLSKFGAETSLGQTGLLGKALPMVAGTSVLGGVSDAFQPKLPKYKPEETKPYVQMAPGRREVRFPTAEEERGLGTKEYTYFTPSNPAPVPMSSLSEEERRNYGYAEGGLATTAPAMSDFEALVASYQNQNPGAITASMYPTPPAATTPPPATTTPPATTAPGTAGYTATPSSTGGETVYNFGRTPNVRPNTGTGYTPGQTISIPGFGNIQLPDFSNMDFSGYTPPASNPTIPTNTSTQTNTPYDFSGIDYSNMDFSGYNPAATQTPVNTQTPAATQTPDSSQFVPGSMASIPGVGNIQLPDFSNMDFSGYNPAATQTPAADTTRAYDTMTPGIYGRFNFDRNMDMDEFARGGKVNMRDGSFVVDARTVSELGNGSSNAGMELLQRLGGMPLKGPGDGVSDSIPARIGGKQEARVARDEVIMPPEAVRRIGKGSEKRGTQKLYALMDKAHKARKKAKRGQDTGLRRGLA